MKRILRKEKARMLLKKMYGFKLCFYSPPQSDIVLFDESHLELITKNILNGYSYFIYNMRPEKIYINPLIIFFFLKSFRLIDWSKINFGKSSLWKALVWLRRNYRMASFFVMKPKVVITIIDNSSIFHWLSRNYKDAEFFAIQNGHRSNLQFKNTSKRMHIPHYFCFGNYDKDRYSKMGHNVGMCYPVGSLKLGVYKENSESNKRAEYEISIISEYRDEVFNNISSDRLQKRANIMMHEYLSKYINNNNIKKVALIGNRYNDINEIDFFEKIYKDSVDFIKNDRLQLTSYRIVDNSEVVVGFYSTLISEAFGMGKKVLRIDFTESNIYNEYDPIILIKDPDYFELERRLNRLLAEPYEDYRKRTREYASYIMNYNPDCPPHMFIRKKIEEYL